MKRIFALMAVALLLFGCPGGEQAPEGQQQSAEQAGTPQGGEQAAEQEGAESGAGEESGGEEAGGLGLEEWSMAAMMAMGTPVHCSGTDAQDGMSSTFDIYIMGESYRAEGTSSYDGETYSYTMVLKGQKMYMKDDGTGMGMGMFTDETGCEWYLIDNAKLESELPESEEGAETEFTGTPDFEEMPQDYSCEAASFGDEKFSTPGKICDITEDLIAMMQMGAQPGPGDDPCAGLPADARDACYASYGGAQ